MKLSDSELSKYATNVIQNAGKIIDEFGDREPGSEGERNATHYLRKEFEPLVDKTEIQRFKVTPKLYMGIGTYIMIPCLLAVVFFWLIPWLGFIFSSIGLFLFLSVSWFYVPWFDRFLPQKESQNLMCVKKPKGEILRRLVIHGHIDASFEMRFQLIGRKLHIILVASEILFVLINFIFSILNLIFNTTWATGYQSGWLIVGIILTSLSLISIPTFLFYNYKIVSPGANDNLSGTLVVLKVAKIFKEKNWQLENTEIIYLTTGSEEAGTRGALHFAQANKEMLSSIDTAFISLDVLSDTDRITVLSSDHNGMVKMDEGVQKLLSRAAKERNVKFDIQPFPPGAGSTDGARFQRAGYPAGSIVAVDHNLPTFYHSRLDTPAVMDKECLTKVIDLMLATIDIYDREGIEPV